jgi:hypothetical protein
MSVVVATNSSLSMPCVARRGDGGDSCLRGRRFLDHARHSDDTFTADGAIDDVVGVRAGRRYCEWSTGRWRTD